MTNNFSWRTNWSIIARERVEEMYVSGYQQPRKFSNSDWAGMR